MWAGIALLALAGCADVVALPGDGGVDGELDHALPPADAEPAPEMSFGSPDDARAGDGSTDMSVDMQADMPDAPGPCITPIDEVCNGRDDDCDGASDEGAVCCRENPEICNGIDDDCDGSADEGAVCCGENPEVCNGVDDDCDGSADEGLVCCDPVDEVCDDSDNDCDGAIDEGDVCCVPGPEVCDGADNDCDGQIDEAGAEVCNGADDDCDGRSDEGSVCGLYVQQNCRLFMGWADERLGPAGASPIWGACPGVDRFTSEDVACSGTRYDGAYARLSLRGDVDDNDQFGWALLCRDGSDPALSAWVQGQCALFVGYADENRAPAGGAVFAGCPQQIETRVGNLRCTSTGFDGNFRALNTQGDVDDNDDLSFAWICRDDPARPGLAAAVQGQVEVFAGWADENRGPPDGAQAWSTCPPSRSQQNGEVRCIGTGGDGLFHKLNLIGDVNGDDQAGIALRARP